MFHGNVSLENATGLRGLRRRIDAAGIPSSKLDETLNLATWNIREFGKKRPTEAAIHYIAEIIGQFDIVSIVELRDNLSDPQRVLEILGPYWRVVYSDVIPDDGGNQERIAFVYDKRAVVHTGFAVCCGADQRKQLERLCRYITRAALANERLSRRAQGQGDRVPVREK